MKLLLLSPLSRKVVRTGFKSAVYSIHLFILTQFIPGHLPPILSLSVTPQSIHPSSDIDSEEADISPPPLHSVREEERAAKVLQDIGRGRILKRAENSDLKRSAKGEEHHLREDYEEIGGRYGRREDVAGTTEDRVLNSNLKRSSKRGEKHHLRQDYGGKGDVTRAADTFEWVDFKRNGKF